ncbi:hypothetical protein Sjap_000632 [Stephania japonica]|uniref:Uncharacterized protein n=1 Tax=Stephania japonica TaxID=461633 RepID=A0AAP0KKS8_9MAGN
MTYFSQGREINERREGEPGTVSSASFSCDIGKQGPTPNGPSNWVEALDAISFGSLEQVTEAFTSCLSAGSLRSIKYVLNTLAEARLGEVPGSIYQISVGNLKPGK